MKRKHIRPQINTAGLAAYYKLWAGLSSPTTVFDYSLNGLTGTVAGTNCAPAYPGFSFNGTDDYIDVGTGPASVKSVALWIKQDDIAGNEYPIDLNGTDFISVASGAVTVNGFTAASLYVDAAAGTSGVTAIAANTWAFIVVTDTTASNATDFDIGKETANFFDGIIGEVMLFDKVLALSDIKSIYETTRWRYV